MAMVSLCCCVDCKQVLCDVQLQLPQGSTGRPPVHAHLQTEEKLEGGSGKEKEVCLFVCLFSGDSERKGRGARWGGVSMVEWLELVGGGTEFSGARVESGGNLFVLSRRKLKLLAYVGQ